MSVSEGEKGGLFISKNLIGPCFACVIGATPGHLGAFS